MNIPNEIEIKVMVGRALEKMKGRFVFDGNSVRAKHCVCCDCFGTYNNEIKLFRFDKYVNRCKAMKLVPEQFEKIYPKDLVDQYTLKTNDGSSIITSPSTELFNNNGKNFVHLCEQCYSVFNCRSKKTPPKYSIANYLMVGEPPDELKCLTTAELAIVSMNRIICQGIVLRSDSHKGVYGWHSLFANNVENNMGNIEALSDAGMKNTIICVLCGPFTKTQVALTKEKMSIRPQKIIDAFNWLIANNTFYANMKIPDIEDIPLPIFIEESDFSICNTTNPDIENQFNVTILFPDHSVSTENKGGFKSQDEFRNFLIDHTNARVEHQFHTRPTRERVAEYSADELIKALPLQFPYGFAGMPNESNLSDHFKKSNSRTFEQTLRYFCHHRIKSFHSPEFNLFITSTLMKQNIFLSSRIQCNIRKEDTKTMSDLFGQMSSEELEYAIYNMKLNNGNIRGNKIADQFLRSIQAICESLPHSNNSAKIAKRKYFSLIAKFGLPTLFVTISPDDQRSLWIKVYANFGHDVEFTEDDCSNDKSKEQLIFEYELRCKDRTENPGLCAEDFDFICNVFINDLLQWDPKSNKAKSVGLFGKVIAFAQATEEQGRKSLHAHYLIWIEGWNEFMECLMTIDKRSNSERIQLTNNLVQYVSHCSSTKMFGNVLAQNEGPIFYHEGCRRQRNHINNYFSVECVSKNQLSEMRTRYGSTDHKGHIATCLKCQKNITIHELITNKLRSITKDEKTTVYPDKTRKLDNIVLRAQFDFEWHNRSDRLNETRLFLSNALTNIHSINHSPRCFKKTDTCYANFPKNPNEKSVVEFSMNVSTWSDWKGDITGKKIFRVVPSRELHDIYTNEHNPTLTKLFLCNNNIMTAMTGAAVFYVTHYNNKCNQKDEREAFEHVGKVLKRITTERLNNSFVEDGNFRKEGFKRMLAAVYSHSNSLLIAAPMAHYLTVNESRFKYSHEFVYVPLRSIEIILSGRTTIFRLVKSKNKRVPYCRALDYLYRPSELENLCPFDFYQKYELISKKEASKSGKQSYYLFSDHPKENDLVCVKRDKPDTLPEFEWMFFGDTKKLKENIFQKGRRGNYSDEAESHARRILIAFSAYRKEEDMKYESSYVAKLQHMVDTKQIDKYTHYLNNCQNIRNSLDAGTLDDVDVNLKEDTEEFEYDDSQFIEELLNDFQPTTDNVNLSEEPTKFYFKGKDPVLYENRHQDGNNNQEIFENIFRQEIESNQSNNMNHIEYRQTVSPVGLNTLFQKKFESNTSSPEVDYVVEVTGTAANIIDYGLSRKLDLDQQTAFEILAAEFVLSFVIDSFQMDEIKLVDEMVYEQLKQVENELKDLCHWKERNGEPLRMFLTGPAGAGKSAILDALMDFVQKFMMKLGRYMDDKLIRLTALTGSAATDIKGRTIHSEVKFGSKVLHIDINQWKNTRILVIDEISFGGYETFMKQLSCQLQQLTEHEELPYGNVPIVFIGDFFQLEPREKKAYEFVDGIYWEGHLNTFVELRGSWRFKDCPKLKNAFSIFRKDGMTKEMIDMFNTRVIGQSYETKLDNGKKMKKTITMPNIRQTQIATYTNKLRSEMNDLVFMDHLKSYHSKNILDPIPNFTVVLKAYTEWTHNRQPLTFSKRFKFFSEATENSIRSKTNRGKRASPLLKLFYNMSIMVLENDDVSNGIANGTTAKFQSITLKQGKSSHRIQINDFWVHAVNTEDIEYITLRWTEDSNFRGTFQMKPLTRQYEYNFKTSTPKGIINNSVEIRMHTFAITANHATTCHKLQGKSKESLIIGEWATNVSNWIYVILSRVKTLDGLFLTSKIPENAETKPPKALIEMLDRLRSKLAFKTESTMISGIRQNIYARRNRKPIDPSTI